MASAQELITYLEGIRDERRESANTATRIGTALLRILHYIIDDDSPFLRKDKEDATGFLIKCLAGVVVGKSDNVRVNPDGSIICGSIKVDGSAIFDELVFNHQNVLEGDTYFTDRGIIESVEHTDVGQYTLTFRKEYDADRTTFHVNDILRGTVNRLDTARSYYSFWLRVESVDTDSNTAVCSMYADSDVQGGKNYPPVAAARVIRWGNTVDTSRQSVWFVSSKDGRWLFLQGIDKPILEDSSTGSNYAAFVGLPPDITGVRELLQNGLLSEDQPCIYAETILARNFIKIDYKGKPVYQARDCGQWNASRKYIHGYDATEKGYYSDRVWWKGCYWQCSVDESSGSEPRYGNTDWTCLLGGSNMSIDIQSSAGNWFRAGSDWTTTLTATVWNAEMQLSASELSGCTVTWLRESDDTEGDTAWNTQHETVHTLTINISSATDLPSVWRSGSKVGYRIYIVFPDGNSYNQNYTVIN